MVKQKTAKVHGTRASRRIFLLSAVLIAMMSAKTQADQILMTLSVQSSQIRWQDEFILTLEIYGPPNLPPPDVSIGGLDQFQLRGMGKNLLQVPLGKTAKWILTYNLTAHQEGTFKLGPAVADVGDKRFVSNTLFVTVVAPSGQAAKPAPPGGPVVHSASEIGDRVKIQMEISKKTAYRNEPVVVRLRLLSQFPVENLRFKEEADFPGFLKYDFPFSSNPQAQWVREEDKKFASYELEKFLLFPMKAGKLQIPAVDCQLRVRPPSGAYTEANLTLDIDRSSNSLEIEALPTPPADVTGDFILRNQLLTDEPRVKRIRVLLEGSGQLTTFDFDEPSDSSFSARLINSSTSSTLQDETLKSRKATDYEISPNGNTTSVILPPVRIRQFNPAAGRISVLRLPQLRLNFSAPGLPASRPVPLPQTESRIVWVFCALAAFSLLLPFGLRGTKALRPNPPRIARLFNRKNPSLQISKDTAQKLYRQMQVEICSKDRKALPILEILKRHVPESEWMPASRAMRKFEALAFSPFRETALTYQEMRAVCDRLERSWLI